jgi:uncharacterized coiled-coil protein SlyX
VNLNNLLTLFPVSLKNYGPKNNEISEMAKTVIKQKNDIATLMEGISRQKVELEKVSAGMRTMSEKREELTSKVLDQ